MATEKRLIDVNVAIERAKNSDKIVGSSIWETGEVVEFLEDCPIVDAVEVDKFNIRLHHILIDNEGVPEVKLQIGDKYFILHTDPVDVAEVVHGRWVVEHEESVRCSKCCFNRASIKMPLDYCPNCGAKMDAERRTDGRKEKIDTIV